LRSSRYEENNVKRVFSATLLVGLAVVGAAGCSVSSGSQSDDVVVVEATSDYYEPCAFSDECPGFSECWDIAVDYGDEIVIDAMCTEQCSFDDECAFDGKCTVVTGAGPLCYERCIDDFDCWDGFACVEVDDDLDPVCIPW
jgi:hypothetical protein